MCVAYPAAMPSVVSHVRAADGTDLLARHWPADEVEAGGAWAGAPWASVLLVHGVGEHSGRYEHVGDQLTAAGLDVAAYDHRGMGGSGGRRGDIEQWSQLHDDLAERLAVVRVTAGVRPVMLYAHSLGGLISAGYLLSERPKPDIAVLTSPALGDTVPAWKRRLVGPLAKVVPTLPINNDFDGATLSRDPSVAARTIDDPSCVKASTARFAVAAFGEQARVRAGVGAGFGIPVLVLHGEDDGLVPVSASEVLGGVPLVERRTYPALRHELHNEPEGPSIVEEIIAWLRDRLAGAR
jgi:alpha-beta hydrolase superfamily lysophospholipase